MNLRTAWLGLGCAALLQSCNCGDEGGRDAGSSDASVPDASSPVGDAGRAEAAAIDLQGDLVLVRGDGSSDLLVQHGDAGTTARLESPRWNPQGTRLAFTDCDRAFIRESDGTVAPAHTRQGARYRNDTCRVEWSPDGTRLAIDGTDDANDAQALFLVPAGGGNPIFVSDVEQWGWEPSGQSLVYATFDPDLSSVVTSRYLLATGDAGVLFEGELLGVMRNGLLLFQRQQVAADGGMERAVLYWWPDGGVTPALPLGSFEPLSTTEGATTSPYADEFLVRGRPANSPGRNQAVRVSLGGQTTTLFDTTTGFPPGCFRFVPGGELLSFEDGEPPVLFAFSKDGGSARLPSPELGGNRPGCLDWRSR